MMDEQNPARRFRNEGRLLVFKLNGGPVPPQPVRTAVAESQRFEVEATQEQITHGIELYRRNCGRCHGMLTSKALLPDLRQLSDSKQQIFAQIVLGGILRARWYGELCRRAGRGGCQGYPGCADISEGPSGLRPRHGDSSTRGLRPGY